MPIRGSPNAARHPRPQAGRERPEWVVAISRNAWSQSIGMPEASNWSRVTDIAPRSARDQFEAGLNEAACCRARPMGVSARYNA